MGLMKLRDMQGLRWQCRDRLRREVDAIPKLQIDLFENELVDVALRGGAGEWNEKAITKELSK